MKVWQWTFTVLATVGFTLGIASFLQHHLGLGLINGFFGCVNLVLLIYATCKGGAQ